jgi:hypothetical protein
VLAVQPIGLFLHVGIDVHTVNVWNLTGSTASSLNGTLAFAGFENLTGGSTNDTTLTSLGQGVQHGLTGGIGFWDSTNGQALINSFNSSEVMAGGAHDIEILRSGGKKGPPAQRENRFGDCDGSRISCDTDCRTRPRLPDPLHLADRAPLRTDESPGDPPGQREGPPRIHRRRR